jgi:hypothetical protein
VKEGLTVGDWLTALAAIAALGLSGYNTYTQWRDRTPRVEMVATWNFPKDAPTAWAGTANPGEPVYQCEMTNVGVAGVKIIEAKIFFLRYPAKPLRLHPPEGEQPRKLDNGDSQTWLHTFTSDSIPGPANLDNPDRVKVQVVAWDTVGNAYKAKDPAPFPWEPFDFRKVFPKAADDEHKPQGPTPEEHPKS